MSQHATGDGKKAFGGLTFDGGKNQGGIGTSHTQVFTAREGTGRRDILLDRILHKVFTYGKGKDGEAGYTLLDRDGIVIHGRKNFLGGKGWLTFGGEYFHGLKGWVWRNYLDGKGQAVQQCLPRI